MSGILTTAGIVGFLDNLKAFHDGGERTTAPEDPAAFIAEWWSKHRDMAVGAQTLIDLEEAEGLIGERKDDNPKKRVTRLGLLLANRQIDKVFDVMDKPNVSIRVKLVRAEYIRPDRKGTREGFKLCEIGKTEPAKNVGEAWQREKARK